MKNIYLALLVVLLVAMLVTGCNNSSSTTSSNAPSITSSQPNQTIPATSTTPSQAATPQYGGTFRVIDDRPPSGTLGWFAEPGPPAGMWYHPMFEGLVRPQYSGAVLPVLATDWNIANDLTSVTFHLQKNVKFHDGSDFNAAVAKWIFDQFLAAKMSSVKFVSSVEVVDDFTIKVNLSSYSNTILYDLSSIAMVSKTAFDANGGKEYLRNHPVGTGPFKFVSYTPDTVMKFTKFNDYWQKGFPYLDAIEVSFVADPMTAAASFEAGEADAVTSNSPQILYDLKQKKFGLITGFTGAITLIPDSKNADSPFANVKVRQAIDYAIDREALVKAKGYGMWATTYQFAAPDSSAYLKNLQSRSYNPEKAKQLLAEAGYANGLKITLIGDGSSTDKDSTVALQGFLSKVGITADLNWVDYAGFVGYVMKGWNNGMLACANGFSPNLNSGVSFVWSQKAMFFPSVLKTDANEKLISAAMASRDYDPVLVQKYLQSFVDEAMFNPLYCIIRGMALNTKVHDTGFLQGYGPYTWNPLKTWVSK